MITKNELKSKLRKYNIQFENWNKSKTILDLLNEINKSDSFLKEENGELLRVVKFVNIKVTFENLILKEEIQIFKNGGNRKRNLYGVSEKIRPNENIYMGCFRAMEEELGLEIYIDQLEYVSSFKEIKDSNSYPGLKTEYNGHIFKCELDIYQHNPDGFVEEEENKTTYFVWEELN
jgi:hypothetical protein